MLAFTLASTLLIASATAQRLDNGKAAQALNAKFASIKAGDACDASQMPNACINGGFSQCVNGAFSTPTPCAGGLGCFALPLVNSVGTSVTCDTQADAETRIANTGATGGLTGNNAAVDTGATKPATGGNAGGNAGQCNNAPAATSQAAASAASAPATGSGSGAGSSTSFRKNNGIEAQNLNDMFKTLNANSACDAAALPAACLSSGEFVQCVDGKFSAGTKCSGGLICTALPLVNKAGTSVTCDTAEDAKTRIADALAS